MDLRRLATEGEGGGKAGDDEGNFPLTLCESIVHRTLRDRRAEPERKYGGIEWWGPWWGGMMS